MKQLKIHYMKNRRPALRTLFFLLACAWAASLAAQLQPAPLPARLPAGLAFEGSLSGGCTWEDRNGRNFLLLTLTEPRSDGAETLAISLYAYHYALRNDSLRLLRRIQDFERGCMFDLAVGHVENSLQLSDLDQDGLAEICFLYTLGCRSDISPAGLKLMLLENGEKYALRGLQRMRIYVKGEVTEQHAWLEGYAYEAPAEDAAFAQAPPAFLTYARRQWNQFCEMRLDLEE